MRRIATLIGIVVILALTGCGKFDEIKINSVKPENIQMYGLKGLEVALAVEVENPAPQISLSEMKADVMYCGKILGTVTADPFTIKARTTETYHVDSKFRLSDDMSYYDLLMFLDRDYLEKCVVDITVKAKLKCGISKTITKTGVPLKKLLKNAKKNK